MSWFTDFFSSSVSSVVDSVGEAVDKLVTSDEERLKLKNELIKIQSAAKLKEQELDNRYEEEITKRNTADQTNGNFITKSIRPLFLVWVMCIITILVFGGMFGFTVAPGYIDLITALSITAVSFFFGSKGIEAYRHGKIL